MARPLLIAFLSAAIFGLMTLVAADQSAETGYAPIKKKAPTPATVLVEKGDHLWKISKRGLSHALQREPGNEEVHPYWVETIAINRGSLRSGDPDLIYPGEQVMLPDS